MRILFGVAAGVIALFACVPYIIDILHGQARPARSTRIMYMLLMVLALIQQHQLGSTWALLLIIGELIQAILILGLSYKFGMGGITRLDMGCYALLAINIVVWQSMNNALIGIYLTILADLIASVPTLYKSYKRPETETAAYFSLGAVSGLLAVFSQINPTYSNIVFPLYIAIINAVVAVLIMRGRTVLKNRQPLSIS